MSDAYDVMRNLAPDDPWDETPGEDDVWIHSDAGLIRWSQVARLRNIGGGSVRFEATDGTCLGYLTPGPEGGSFTSEGVLEAVARNLRNPYTVLAFKASEGEETP